MPEPLHAALRHEAALRGLATALAGRGADADDAVQHTLTQAARGRATGGVPLLAFLRTTLRNHVRNVRKLAARRRAREAAVARVDAAPSAADLAAREELRHRVARAVLTLPEPGRTVVWLRWFEGLDVTEVAARLGCPAATVRTRLHRAHALLRERLDADYGDRCWAAFAAPLAAPSLGGLVLVPGGLLVGKLAAAVLAAVVVAAVLVLLRSDAAAPAVDTVAAAAPGGAPVASSPAEPEPGVVRHEAPAERPLAPPAVSAGAVPHDPTDAQLVALAGAATAGEVVGIVADGSGPLAGGDAWLGGRGGTGLPWGTPEDWHRAPDVRHTRIGADGRFTFRDVEPGTWTVGVRTAAGAARHAHVTVPEGGDTGARVCFAMGHARVVGRVFDPDGLPAANWRVAAWTGGVRADTQLILAAVTDATGAFVVDGLCGGHYWVHATPGADFRDERKQTASIVVGEGATAAVELGVGTGGSVWTGRLLLPDGTEFGAIARTDLELRSGSVATTFPVSPAGHFRGRIAPGEHNVRLCVASGTAVDLGTVVVLAGTWTHDVVLPRVLRVRPTFPANGAPPRATSAVNARLTLADGGSALAVAGADGRAYFFDVPPGDHTLACWPRRIAGAPASGMRVTMPAQSLVDLDVLLQPR